MTRDNDDQVRPAEGVSRRDLLKRGAVFGGALMWATPVVQTVGMGRAFAQTASPVGDDCFSYVAVNFVAGVDQKQLYSKFDAQGWDSGTGKVATQCPGFTPNPNGTLGSTWGLSVVGSGLNWVLSVPAGVTVQSVAVFGANQCSVISGGAGPTRISLPCPSSQGSPVQVPRAVGQEGEGT